MDQKEYVQNMLTKVINPALAAHGGQAVLSRIDENGVVSIRLTGACAGCMVAADTFENLVKKAILDNAAGTGITDVVPDDSVSEDLLDFARRILSGALK